MKVAKISKLSLLDLEDKDKVKNYLLSVDTDLRNLVNLSQNRIRFGTGSDGADGENVSGSFKVFTSNAVADTEETIAHGLGAVPIGFIVINRDKASSLYDSGTAWTSTNAYVKSDTASTTYTVFFIK